MTEEEYVNLDVHWVLREQDDAFYKYHNIGLNLKDWTNFEMFRYNTGEMMRLIENDFIAYCMILQESLLPYIEEESTQQGIYEEAIDIYKVWSDDIIKHCFMSDKISYQKKEMLY